MIARTSSVRTLCLALALGIALAAPAIGVAGDRGKDDDPEDEEVPFDEASIFFELNDTDGDLGIHALIDGEAWQRLQISDPNERKLLDAVVKGRLRKQGLTELFFESDEPSFDELPPAAFFARFPEGEYEIEGRTLEGDELESEVEVSHVMPAPAGGILLSGVPAVANCDVVPLPVVSAPVVISWTPVTSSHPSIGATGPIVVEKYQVVVENDDGTLAFTLDLPPNVTSVEVPEAFTDLEDEFKFEIIVRAENGNQTAVESCFELD